MTTALLESPLDTCPLEEYLYLEDVPWECYEMLVAAAHDRRLQITFDQGRMEIMSPLPRHENVKTLVGMMIGIMSLERNIPMRGLGSTTFRRKLLGKGLEPDQCYYIQNEKEVRFKDDLDLDVDPPPDLAVEIDVTSRSIDRLPIYAALGIPEIWRHNGLRLQALWLNRGAYQQNDTSRCFAFLNMDEINAFIDRRLTVPETALLLGFREWVRQGM